MTISQMLDEIAAEAEKLLLMCRDRHPGLITWAETFAKQSQTLVNAISRLVELEVRK